ncbi:MAG: ABC transporter permease subunit [Parvibaculum sp.]|nr:ABC transporter permease subunit [Parvibaculum sp.]
MTIAGRRLTPWAAFWLAAAIASFFLAAHGASMTAAIDAGWAMQYPAAWRWPLNAQISAAMKWLVEEVHFHFFTFTEMTRGLAWLLKQPYDFIRSLLVGGFVRGLGRDAVQLLPSLSWLAVVFIVAAMGYYARSWRLALLVAGCFLYLAVFGKWNSAMVTLSSILIAVPLGVVGGLLLGIAGYRWRPFDRVLTPALDLMQTVPIFAYLVPILFLFGFGPVSALIATVIYAMPPMVRVTTLAMRAVPSEIRDFAVMVGCSRRQMTWKVLVPAATPSLMVGVNQVIMLSLNMVIIASMIGAGGLGFEVLSSLRRLDIGAGLEAGIAIVVLAIALDRLSQAFAQRSGYRHSESSNYLTRHPWLVTTALVVLGTGLAGLFVPALQDYPASATVTTAPFWSDLVRSINIAFFDQFEAAKVFMLVNILMPVKRFMLALPWPWLVLLATIAGWQLGGWRLATLCLGLSVFIAVNGLWELAMVTIYLCGISVAIAAMIGIPLGILATENAHAQRIVGAIIDTLQTLPSFVYLIPVVMLFRVGDFAAMIAVILYALAPAVRYTAHGIRNIDPQLIEAGIVSGCTRRQLLWRIKMPLAMPEIMLGINQTIMLALSMLVITALVGTRDLGQEVYIALTKADVGRGLVAGAAIAFIAIIADRLISAGAARTRQRLGLA